MTITTTWKVEGIECLAQVDEYTDVVHIINWRVYASNGSIDTSVYSACIIDLSPESVFTPYDQLTEEMVLSWVHSSLGEEGKLSAESNAISTLEGMITPKIVNKTLPWSV